MSTTFNTSVRVFGYQQTQIDSLTEVVLENHRALNLLTILQGETCTLLGEECCLYVSKSGKITEELKIMKDNIKLLAEIGQAPGTWDIFYPFNISNWGNWLRGVLQSIVIIGLSFFILIILIKFILFCISKQMSSSQMYVQIKLSSFQRHFLKLN